MFVFFFFSSEPFSTSIKTVFQTVFHTDIDSNIFHFSLYFSLNCICTLHIQKEKKKMAQNSIGQRKCDTMMMNINGLVFNALEKDSLVIGFCRS